MGKRIVVIGSGGGGAACAAILACRGADVTIFEKNSHVGGKMASFEREGFVFDLGVHYCARGHKGPIARAAKMCGAEIEFLHKDPTMQIKYGDDGSKNLFLPYNLKNIFKAAKGQRELKIPPLEFPGIIGVVSNMRKSLKEGGTASLDHVTLERFIKERSNSELFYNLANGLNLLFQCVPAREGSAGEWIWNTGNFANSASWGYPAGGFGSICESFVKSMKGNGGKIHMDCEVNSILIDNGNAVGVEVDGNTVEADIVISNAGVKRTIQLAEENGFPRHYIKRSRSLKESVYAVTVKYALSKRIASEYPITSYIPESLTMDAYLDSLEKGVVPDMVPMFVPVPSNLDPSMAPNGCQLMISGTMVPRSMEGESVWRGVMDKIDEQMNWLYPGLGKYLIFKIETTPKDISATSGRPTGEIIGIGQTAGQVGHNRPGIRTPVKGLFITGADTGARGVGTEMAVESGIRAAFEVLTTDGYQ